MPFCCLTSVQYFVVSVDKVRLQLAVSRVDHRRSDGQGCPLGTHHAQGAFLRDFEIAKRKTQFICFLYKMAESTANDSRAMKRIAVFCGASSGNDPAYVAAAEALGRAMVQRGIRLVYGGNCGLSPFMYRY
jgi:hypothetical protein